MFSIFQVLTGLFFVNTQLNYSDSLPKKIGQGLETWSINNPSEKVFLHTDKSSYLAGENIWYKAYVTLESKPSILSKIVYIDLVDENGKVVDKQMRPVTSGASAGDIVIPKDLPTGNYSINAYTLWMLNYQPFIFKKLLKIYNYDFKITDVKKATSDFVVDFFPEGGEMVEGLKSNVAFYAVNKKGIPLDLKGTITDQSGKAITVISTTNLGYGKFEITPAPNEILTATITANGVEKKFTLPSANKEGITLKVNNTNANMVFVKVDRNVAIQSTYNNVLVVAQLHGTLAFMGMVNFAENATGMAIPKKNLQPGIMQITAFDTNGNPLAERLAFINTFQLPDVSLHTDTVSLQTRGKNKFTVNLSNFSSPSVSISITDAELSGKIGTEDNILSNLLLTSDLKGYIHQPGYYLKNKNAATMEHLDLLMLTHGWRRFNWEEIINNKQGTLKYPVESGISISGKATVPVSTKTIAGGYVDIITKGEDSTTILSKALVNGKGEFFVDDLNFKQKATVYLQGTKTSNQNANVDIILNKNYIDTLKRSVYIPTVDAEILNDQGSSKVKQLALFQEEVSKNKMYTLENVKVTTRKISRIDSLNANYTGSLFQTGQSLEITSGHYLSIWQFLREQVSGLVVEGDLIDPNVYFSRFSGLTAPTVAVEGEDGVNQAGGMESNGITYFLNEINVSKDVINTIHPTDIALIKVFKGPEGTALGLNEGGIALYTKKGIPDKSRTGEKGFFKETKIGYSVTREFYNPNYAVISNATIKDNRQTLYWNGNAKLDKTGITTILFFNNDITKKYKIIIQGIDKKGSIIFKEQIIE